MFVHTRVCSCKNWKNGIAVPTRQGGFNWWLMANRFSTVGQSFIALCELDARVWCRSFMKDKLSWFEPEVYSKIMNAYVSRYTYLVSISLRNVLETPKFLNVGSRFILVNVEKPLGLWDGELLIITEPVAGCKKTK